MIQNIKVKENMLDKELLKEKIIEREEIMATETNSGIAIPHTELENIDEFIIVTAVLKNGIKWEESIVNIVFLILKPKNSQKEYLKILSKISKLFRNKEKISKLIECENVEAFIKNLMK